MQTWQKALQVQAIAHEFEDVDENLENDLSGVHVTAVEEAHDGGIELEIFIYGKGEEESEPPVVHVQIPMSCEIFDSENLLNDGSINPEKLLNLFDQEFLDILRQRNICIHWNSHWPTKASIDPLERKTDSPLFPERQ